MNDAMSGAVSGVMNGAAPTAVVVVTYGAHELLDQLAQLDLSAAPADVVVVDNFHSARERAAIAGVAHREGWTFLPMDGNRGFGAAANRGVAHALDAGAHTVLLLNPDATVTVEVLHALRSACEAQPLTLLSPLIESPDGSVWFRGSYLDLRTGRSGSSERFEAEPRARWLTATCLMVHRELWQRVGGFDERFFLYWEDVELSWRVRRAGGELAVRHDLRAVHDQGGTQRAGRDGPAKSSVYYRYNCRNRLLFAALHLPRRDLLRWIAGTPRASWAILLRGGGRRKLVRSPGLAWAALRGTVEGLAVAVAALLRGAARDTRAGADRPDLARVA